MMMIPTWRVQPSNEKVNERVVELMGRMRKEEEEEEEEEEKKQSRNIC